MTERIDHAAQAQTLERNSWRRTGGGTGDFNLHTDVARSHMLAAAQVHATLALVEQQRIANLLMLSSWTQDATNADIGYDLDKLRTGVAGEVWEGLGLA